jgi:signal transduction histidine kinase
MRTGILVGGVALGIVAYRTQVDNLVATTNLKALATVASGWSFLVAGVIAWSRRPANRMGPLMVACCFALFARQLRYAHDEATFTTFFALGELGYALVAQTVLAYPSGIVRDRLEVWFVRITYTVVIAFPVAILLFYDGTHQLRYFDARPRNDYLSVYNDGQLARHLQDVYAVTAYGVLASIFIVLIVRKLARATPRTRRIMAPLILAAVLAAMRAVFDSVLTFSTRPPAIVYNNLFWWQIAALTALPIALLIGLLRARLAQGSVGDLVVRLERAHAHAIRDELAEAIGDPSLEVALWLPDRREFVDEEGRPVTLPDNGPARAVTKLEHEGEPLAALIHDPELREEPDLLAAASAAASMALDNARLQAELLAQLAKVKESRSRLVAAADEERRRIERNLHDGLQQRLVAIALDARGARRRLGRHADPEVARVLDGLAEETQVAVRELRELAHGIHPAVLTEGGLAAALASLAGRAPVPVRLHTIDERFAAEIEAAAYFVAAEALTNVAKHAHANAASLSARHENSTLLVEVRDDGVGGASPERGSGLRGLIDRVEAHGGRVRIESEPGEGTRVVGEIPCGS